MVLKNCLASSFLNSTREGAKTHPSKSGKKGVETKVVDSFSKRLVWRASTSHVQHEKRRDNTNHKDSRTQDRLWWPPELRYWSEPCQSAEMLTLHLRNFKIIVDHAQGETLCGQPPQHGSLWQKYTAWSKNVKLQLKLMLMPRLTNVCFCLFCKEFNKKMQYSDANDLYSANPDVM